MRLHLFILSSCLLVKLSMGGFFSSEKENTHCTELKQSIEPNILLHVPCVFIRLMEHLKTCPILSFVFVLIEGIL